MVGRRVMVLLAVVAASIACAAPIAPPAAAPVPAPAPAILPAAAADPPAAPAPLIPPVAVRMGVGQRVRLRHLHRPGEGVFPGAGAGDRVDPFDSAVGMIAPLSTDQLDVGAGSPGPAGTMLRPRPGPEDRGRQGQQPARLRLCRAIALPDRRQRATAGLPRPTGTHIALIRAPPAPRFSSTGLSPGDLTTDDVEIAVMPFPDMGLALANRSIDLAVGLEPSMTAVRSRGCSSAGKAWTSFIRLPVRRGAVRATVAREQAEGGTALDDRLPERGA